jgi:ABC-type uncharacterized transport system substrate-binding protein
MQQAGKRARIGVQSVYDPLSAAALQPSPFPQGLRELGWAEGQNLEVEQRYAEGHTERLLALAAELVRLPVDVILAIGPPEARAVKQATTRIPIVFISVGNPVRAGLVASLAQPGGNVTGLSSFTAELSGAARRTTSWRDGVQLPRYARDPACRASLRPR